MSNQKIRRTIVMTIVGIVIGTAVGAILGGQDGSVIGLFIGGALGFLLGSTKNTGTPRVEDEQSRPLTAQKPRKAFDHLSSILVAGEELQASAVQRRLYALGHRRIPVFATSGRFIGMTRGLIGGFTLQDARWQDVKDARIQVGILAAELTIDALAAPDLTFAGETSSLSRIIFPVRVSDRHHVVSHER